MKCKYEHDGDCCNAGADQYMCKCKKPCGFIWPLSNADHIRSMTDKELAEWTTKFMNAILKENNMEDKFKLDSNFTAMALDWLKQPYKEEL